MSETIEDLERTIAELRREVASLERHNRDMMDRVVNAQLLAMAGPRPEEGGPRVIGGYSAFHGGLVSGQRLAGVERDEERVTHGQLNVLWWAWLEEHLDGQFPTPMEDEDPQ